MATPTLIYCAGKNRRCDGIAKDCGFELGARLPGTTIYHELYFIDQDWKNPNLGKYLEMIKRYKPFMATVLDLEHHNQLSEVLSWAESIAPFVQVIVIIPKAHNIIDFIPGIVGGKHIRLGYSVPTKFGGTPVGYSEFYGRAVHILGGSPQRARQLTKYLNIVSLDGNTHLKMAMKYAAFFDPAKRTKRGYWPTIKDFDREEWGGGGNADATYEAFRRSCVAIMQMWNGTGNYNKYQTSIHF